MNIPDPGTDHPADGGGRGREEDLRADSSEPGRRASAAAHARRADRPCGTVRRRGQGAQDRRLRRAGAAQPARRRSAVAGGRWIGARQPGRRRDRRRAAAARAARGLRKALRLHPCAALFHPHGLLDRAAPLAHREGVHRLREMPAVPAVRPVRDGRAARRDVRCRARLRSAGGVGSGGAGRTLSRDERRDRHSGRRRDAARLSRCRRSAPVSRPTASPI